MSGRMSRLGWVTTLIAFLLLTGARSGWSEARSVVHLQASLSPAAADSLSPESVVQGQLESYNRRDLEGFLAFFDDSVRVYSPPQTLRNAGKKGLRRQYGALFERSPDLNARVTQRMSSGRFVIDQEVVTGLPGGRRLEALVIYEVVNGLIVNVWFLSG